MVKRSLCQWLNGLLLSSEGVWGSRVGNLVHNNFAFLFRCWCRFSQEDVSFWKRIVSSIHLIKGMMASKDGFCSAKFGVWAQLINSDEETSLVKNMVSEGMC